jgi:hypothetical protein
MKQTIAIAATALALMSAPALAKESPANNCKLLGDVAGKIMSLRQDGVTPSQLMDALSSDKFDQLILVAFNTPRYSSPDFKTTAVEDFRSEIEVECYRKAGAAE